MMRGISFEHLLAKVILKIDHPLNHVASPIKIVEYIMFSSPLARSNNIISIFVIFSSIHIFIDITLFPHHESFFASSTSMMGMSFSTL